MNVSVDHPTISSSVSGAESSEKIEDSFPIPDDLIAEIFSRLSVKVIATCRCVSKLWASILRRQDFTDLFFIRSSARPQLLFVCQNHKGLLFLSSPQPQTPDHEKSSPIAMSYHMSFSFDVISSQICRPVNGLICLKHLLRHSNGTVTTMHGICNTSTGETVYVRPMNKIGVRSYFGYDPIGKEYKVLTKVLSPCHEYQVLTLMLQNVKPTSWRKIKCCIPHYSSTTEICINGVLFYKAAVDRFKKAPMIVCFDFRSEKFRFIQVTDCFIRVPHAALMNYNGKLGTLVCPTYGFVSSFSTSLELWVLEDVENQEWSKHEYVLPALWRNIVGHICFVRFVGVARTNEFVFSRIDQDSMRMPFYIFYYNTERNTIVRVQIQGMNVHHESIIYTLLDHVEDVKLMQVL